MKKHRLLFLLLSLLMVWTGARADEVTIGTEGGGSSVYLPTYAYYNYSITQQIYTADEIGMSGAISSISFYNAKTSGSCVRSLDIYMVATDKESFANGTDWVSVSSSNKVFSGNVEFVTDGWVTIDLDTPFDYNGKSNVVLVVDDNTGSYVGSSYYPSCKTFDATGQAIRAYNDNTDYDPTDLTSALGAVLGMKNLLTIIIGDAPTCAKPMGVTVTATTTTTATVEWEALEGVTYNLHVLSESSEETITNATSPFTLQSLEPSTRYTVQVQTACSDTDLSNWSSPVSFTTLMCEEEDQCLITYSLADSYGDGWNGNAINVVDVESGSILATLTITSGNTEEGTLAVCPGREINFEWVKGSYPGETSWTIYDVNEEEICQGTGTTAMNSGDILATYLVDCTMGCKKPKNIAVSDITSNSATVTWEGEADNYEVRYAEATGTWLQYDNDAPYLSGIGTGEEGTFTWAVMYPGNMITFDKLTKVSIYEAPHNTAVITLKIYTGGDNVPLTNIYTQRITPLSNGWHEITFPSPVTVPLGENLWIELTEDGTNNMTFCQNAESNNQWVLWEGTWYHVGDLGSSLSGYGWMIRGFLGEDTDPEDLSWTTGTCTDNSYELSDLNPETSYIFQVRTKCDEENYSNWVETSFITLEADADPEIEVTDITSTTATVNWTDKGIDPTSWDVWYRPAGETFEDGTLPYGWTTIDADGDGKNWEISDGIKSHSGDYCISSASYDNNTGALTPDNWLVSPEVTLGGSMTFWAIGQDSSWAGEHFAVYVSTSGNTNPDDFVQVYPQSGEMVATSEHVQHTVDLSAYSGKGYVAIRHFNITDMFRLNIDDVLILEPGQNADWVEMNGLTSQPAVLEGLEPETSYEVQVRTHFASGDVSNWVNDYFTTTEGITLHDKDLTLDPNNVTILNMRNGFTLDVTIDGRTLFKTGNWNSLCLPFNIDDIETSPLAEATIKELTAARIEGTMLYLTYTDVSSIEANKSYIIKWDSGDDIVNPVFKNVTLAASTYALANGLTVTELGTELYTFGLYKEMSLEQSRDILYLGSDDKMYYPAASGFHVGAFRTLVQLPEGAGVNETVFEIDGTATSIEEVNGLEIIGGKWYSIDGRELPSLPKQKGVYINNGRKVVVK